MDPWGKPKEETYAVLFWLDSEGWTVSSLAYFTTYREALKVFNNTKTDRISKIVRLSTYAPYPEVEVIHYSEPKS